MLDKACADHPLPMECQQFEDIKVELQRRNSDRSSQAIAFQGMHPHDMANAMASRDRGMLHHAQIQRRMTSSKDKKLW
jgi:hypothetical protein